MLMHQHAGRQNPISLAMDVKRSADGRQRYPLELRLRMYRHLIETIRCLQPSLPIALCLEENVVFEAVGLTASIGRCNCVL